MNPNPAESVKAKKTRRRLRLSCVECTKRRQKCDRANPCGLCTSRGVPHLCYWSPVPIARPTPARPPSHTKTAMIESEDKKEVQQLSDRICLLEQQLEQSRINADFAWSGSQSSSSFGSVLFPNSRNDSPASPALSSSPSINNNHSASSSPEPASWNSEGGPCLDPITLETIALSLQVLPAGQEGYFGRGSSLHTLQTMVNNHVLPNAGLQNGRSYSPIFMIRPNYSQDTSLKLASIVEKIPPRPVTEQLLNTYFNYFNWNFGLPKNWIIAAVAQMWDFLHYPDSLPDTCLDPNWLCLLFALLATASPNASSSHDHNSELFSQCSMTALRIADDMPHFSSFVSTKFPLDGSLLACLAVPLLSKRHAALGRLNEAWKLLGHWIRVAVSLELHHDPQCRQWTDQEKYLRRLAWNNLVMWDRLYSALLGCPSMKQISNVLSEFTTYSEGSFPYLSALHDLGFLAENINQLYLGRDPLHEGVILALDYQLDQWARTNDVEKAFGIDHSGSVKSFSLSCWFLFLKMKLHAFDGYAGTSITSIDNKSCADFCIELIEMQCAAHDIGCSRSDADLGGLPNLLPSLDSSNDNLFMLLEASVTLLLQIDPQHWSQKGAVLEKVYTVFHELSQQSTAMTGNLSYIGLSILQAAFRRWHLEDGNNSSLLTLAETPPNSWSSLNQSYSNFDALENNITLF